MGNSNKSSKSTSSGILSPKAANKQWKTDFAIIKNWSRSQSALNEKEIEACYNNNNVPEELANILCRGPGSFNRHLRASKAHLSKKCNCKEFKNKKPTQIKMTSLSSKEWSHISTHHRTLYEGLRKSRSSRFSRLDLLEIPKIKYNKSAPNVLKLKGSTSNEHKNDKTLKRLKSQKSQLCTGITPCHRFETFCDAYSQIRKEPIQVDKGTYGHCIVYHIDDYSDITCYCTKWDPKSTHIQHIAHGQWFHRHVQTKLQRERTATLERIKSTPFIKYKSLSPFSAPIFHPMLSTELVLSEGDDFEEKKSYEEDDQMIRRIATSMVDVLDEPLQSEAFEELQFGSPFSVKGEEAMFDNPKQETLNNKYAALSKTEWNDLLKKCISFSTAKKARFNNLKVRDIAALKLYTDFDELQRNYRMCFRPNEEKRQIQFFHWNELLIKTCMKSKDVITGKIYHGIGTDLTLSTFSGTYYGPVSTTTLYDIAHGFAGEDGRILELYPSFGKKGLKVSWLSNFPDEEEILYMNTSFQIHNVYDPSVITPVKSMIGGLNANDSDQAYQFERAVMQAIQSININTKVISLNVNDKYTSDEASNDIKENDTSGFIDLETKTQLAVLYLLYLQYRKKEWADFLKKTNKFVKRAFEKFRSEFITLAENVKAVKLEKLSKPMQIFFYTPQKQYQFPIQWYGDKPKKKNKEYKFEYKPNQPFFIDTIVRLFPNAEQVSINADNWDWSLNHFIEFLQRFDMDYANVKLQDIYIKFTAKKSQARARKSLYAIVTDDDRAQTLLQKAPNARKQVTTLRKLGWKFINNSHLHRVSCEPTPELPFVMVFCKPRSNTRFFYRSYSMAITSKLVREVSAPVYEDSKDGEIGDLFPSMRSRSGFALEPGSPNSPESTLMEEKTVEQVHNDMMDGQRFVVVEHNPANCFLNKSIFDVLTYKQELVVLLKWKVDTEVDTDITILMMEDVRKASFFELCNKVETLVLDPMPKGMKEIFMEQSEKGNGDASFREIVSFGAIWKIFPSVNEIFLRGTVLNLRICYKFVEFFEECKDKSVLKRIFFNKPKDVLDTHIMRFNVVLNPLLWEVNQMEYCLQKKNSD